MQPGDHLAVYGTLLSGYSPHEAFGLPDRLGYVRSCTVDGVLYDLGAYPGLVVDGAAGDWDARDGVVHAELYRVRDATLRRELDSFEGYDPADVEGSRYVRERIDLRRPAVRAWVYVYTGATASATVVPSGDWRAYAGGPEPTASE